MNILVFGASTSSTSINKKFAEYASAQIESANATILDLNNFEMPIYSKDREIHDGIPQEAHEFKKLLRDNDGVVISFAEHNGSYSAAFKNIMDWVSRIEGSTWEGKSFFLLSTSPGKRGGITVLNAAVSSFGFMGANVKAQFSLPSFHNNFTEGKGITDPILAEEFRRQLDLFIS